MAEKHVFTRDGESPERDQLEALLRPIMNRPFTVHTIENAIEIFAATFDGVDLRACQEVITEAPSRGESLRDREVTLWLQRRAMQGLIAWLAAQHGKTPAQVVAEIRGMVP